MGVGEGDDRDGREKDRETGAGERDRLRDRVGEREGKKRWSDRGEREKIRNTKKFMEFHLVVLHSAERSEARQVSCYNPLSCFNPVTRDKVGKKKIERETGWERERKIQLGGTEIYRGEEEEGQKWTSTYVVTV